MRKLLKSLMVIPLAVGLFFGAVAQASPVGPLTLQATGAVGNGAPRSAAGFGVATVQVLGAGGFDRTLNFELNEDGTNYVATTCRNVTTNVQSVTATANGVYMCNIPGASLFRARTSGGTTSGTLTVTATFNDGMTDPGAVSGSGSASTVSAPVSPVEGSALFNTSSTSAVATALTTSIAAVAATRVHLYTASAYCSAGSATLTVKDGVAGTTVWVSPAGFIGTVLTGVTWPVGLSSTTANGMDIVLGSCGGGNTGILQVQADRF